MTFPPDLAHVDVFATLRRDQRIFGLIITSCARRRWEPQRVPADIGIGRTLPWIVRWGSA